MVRTNETSEIPLLQPDEWTELDRLVVEEIWNRDLRCFSCTGRLF